MPTGTDSESKRQQLSALINLYEHHLDLFWKWITLYATVVTAIGVYIFNKDIAPSTKPLFPILIAVASLGIALGWLHYVVLAQRTRKRIQTRLQ